MKKQTTTQINLTRNILSATLLKHGQQTKPGFDLYQVTCPDGLVTVRNLRPKLNTPDEFESQTGETFQVKPQAR